jgi:hypothetical protein
LPLLEAANKGFDENYRPSIIVFSKIEMERNAFERLDIAFGIHIQAWAAAAFSRHFAGCDNKWLFGRIAGSNPNFTGGYARHLSYSPSC